MRRHVASLIAGIGFASSVPLAAEPSLEEIANPIGSLASLAIEANHTWLDGSFRRADEQSTTSLVLVPTLPVRLGPGTLVSSASLAGTRGSVPFRAGWGTETGFRDILLLAQWGRTEAFGLLWGLGATAILPTASEPALGQEHAQLGPALTLGIARPRWIAGATWQHWWGITDPDRGERADKGALQPFYWFHVANGWQIGGAPLPTANYATEIGDGDFWIPLNLGVARTTRAGSTPVRWTAQAQYLVTRPDVLGPSWGLLLRIAPVVDLPW